MCYCPHSLWYYSVLLPSFYIVSQCVIVLPSFSTVSQCVIALLSFSTKSQCNFHTDRMSEHIFTFHLVLGWLFVVYHHSITHKSHVHVWLSSFSNYWLFFISQCECPLTCNFAICNFESWQLKVQTRHLSHLKVLVVLAMDFNYWRLTLYSGAHQKYFFHLFNINLVLSIYSL